MLDKNNNLQLKREKKWIQKELCAEQIQQKL